MKFTIVAVVFLLLTIISLIFSFYLYFRLIFAVRRDEDLPGWFYKIGHAAKGRGIDYTEDLVDSCAAKEATFIICAPILANLVLAAYLIRQGRTLLQATYICLKSEFFILVITWLVLGVLRLILGLIRRSDSGHLYASSKAVWGMSLFTCFLWMLTFSIIGFPANPVHFQLADRDYVLGVSRGSDLLAEGYTFQDCSGGAKREADDSIRNERKDHRYYGASLVVMREGRTYGIVNLTPGWGDEAALKDCRITSYRIRSTDDGWNALAVQGRKVADYAMEDYQGHSLETFFHLHAADAASHVGDGIIRISLQNGDYVLFPRYTIEGRFCEDGSPESYFIFCQHTIWE